MIQTLISDNYICLSLDLSDSFNQMPSLKSQHVEQKAVYVCGEPLKCKVGLPLLSRSCAGLCQV